MSDSGVAVVLFPELALTGYAIDDLFGQDPVLDAVHEGLDEIVRASADLLPVIIVGAPLRHQARLFNTGVVIHRGRVLGVVPKIHLPNYREFYERRQFASGRGIAGLEIEVGSQRAPFGTDLLFDATDVPGLTIGVEICEDMFVPVPPSSGLALAGATVLANLSGSPITIGRADTRSVLCRTQSMRCLAAYLYAAAGQGESTTDLSWDGQTSIFENGNELGHGARFEEDPQLTIADIDLDLLRQERARQGTFEDNRRVAAPNAVYRTVEFTLDPPDSDLGLLRTVERFPFVPADPGPTRPGLLRGVQHPGRRPGAAAAGDHHRQGRDRRVRRSRLHPRVDRRGPRDGPARPAAHQHPGLHHARLRHRRRQQVQRLAPDGGSLGSPRASWTSGPPPGRCWRVWVTRSRAARRSTTPPSRTCRRACAPTTCSGWPTITTAIVLGTGDLSELALGWSTYGVGDQMSHYNVNGGVPKTLIQHLIRWVSGLDDFSDQVDDILLSILNAVISPELIPVKEGEVPQSTEKAIGPYELQDFNLFYTLRFGFRPVEDRVPRPARVGGRRPGDLAAGLPAGAPPGLRPARDPPLADRVRAAVLRFRPVQAVRHAQRPEGLPRRIAQPAGRLAGPVGRQRGRLAR